MAKIEDEIEDALYELRWMGLEGAELEEQCERIRLAFNELREHK